MNYHESVDLGEDYNLSFPVYYSREEELVIWCFPTIYDPHINIYKGGTITDSIKCSRISLLEPKYLYPKNCDIPNWILDDSDKNNLMHILQSKSIMNSLTEYNYTSWQYIIHLFNNEMEVIEPSKKLPEDLPIPDYMKL